MWSYYGSKSRIANLYPYPVKGKIIEPFAGSARYALKHFEKEVLLVDKYEVIVRVWKYLQNCSPKDILGLPTLTLGMEINKLTISAEEKLFLGLNAGIASISPRNKVSKFSAEQNGRKNKMKSIADNLFKIKHWEIRHDSFENLENEDATWFIDPPYQFGGHAYVENKINFLELSDWCKSRQGQTIVCENTKADWLPFSPLAKMRGANMKHTIEAVWTNYHTHHQNIQKELQL